jgi:hypothetical protein
MILLLANLSEAAPSYDRLRFGFGSYTQADSYFDASQGFDATGTYFFLPWLGARVQLGVNAQLGGAPLYPTGPTGAYLPYVLAEVRFGEDVGPYCTIGPGISFWYGLLLDASGGWTFELGKRVRLSAVGRLGTYYVGAGAELEFVAF